MALEASGLLPASGVEIVYHVDAAPSLDQERFDKKKCGPGIAVASVVAPGMDRLMGGDDDRLEIEAAIATLALSLCLWPLVWELTRAILQYL